MLRSHFFAAYRRRALARERSPVDLPRHPWPCESRKSDLDEFKIIALRMTTDAIESLDATWQTHGFKSRMDFIRQAMKCMVDQLASADARECFKRTVLSPLRPTGVVRLNSREFFWTSKAIWRRRRRGCTGAGRDRDTEQ